MSFEDVLVDDAEKIAENGFVLIGVEGEGRPSWVYSVGLVDAADHPELVIAGAGLDLMGPVLSTLARSVLAGERYEVGETIDLDHGLGVATFGAVNEVQYRVNTFNMWHQLRQIGAVRTELQALQILLPSTLFCSQHAREQPRLSEPNGLGNSLRRPNREERRRYRPRSG